MTRHASKTILVVDDHPDMLALITDPLAAAGYRTATAADGELGLKAALEHRPDLIIVDLMMPNLNGWQFCLKIRQDPQFAAFKTVPIITLSALVNEDKEGDPQALDMADFYLPKPFDHNILLAKVRELLAKT